MTRAALGGVVAAVAAIACSKPHTDEASPHPAATGAAPAGGSSAGGSSAGGSSAGGSSAGGSSAGGSSAGGSSASSSAGGSSAGGAARSPSGSAARAGVRPTTGELQVRVEWRDVPVAARSSPGRTPCGTPRAASVAPTTTWGVPDALVVVDGAPVAAAPTVARVTLAECALAPRVAAGASLAITSAVERPAKLVLRKRGTIDRLVDGPVVPVLLPIAGHSVTAALDAGAIYALETDAADPEVAFIAALPAQISDATGHVVVRDLAPGTHAVTAWLPPRAGQAARTGRGSATVVAGELAELTVVLSP